MGMIDVVIGMPLGKLMRWCFDVTGGYGQAILFFTLLTKAILLPLSLVAQRNSIKMVRMQPVLADIRAYNSGDGARIAHETQALYRRERYSTLAGILPLLIQIPIILGLLSVIYRPASDYGMTVFMGIDLARVPEFGDASFLITIMSGVSAFALCLAQNRYNVLQAGQGFVGKWGMAIFLVCFSAYFAYVCPGGLGLYWTAGNLLSLPVLALCNVVYPPRKYIEGGGYGEAKRGKGASGSARGAQADGADAVREHDGGSKARRERKRELAAREKADAKRFFDPGNRRQVVFYSEANGYWRYFERLVGYITEHSGLTVHYVTSDPDDRIFGTDNPQIKPYYIGPRTLIEFMMRMDADMVVMTMPDLETFHIKRSLVRSDVEYIYLDHGMTSYTLMLREHALDHFDTVFVYGPNHIEEVRETERVYGLPAKTLVRTGFGLLDTLLEQVESMPRGTDEKKRILIAPSWQMHNIMDSCLDEIVEALSGEGWRITVRPHPEFVKRFPGKMARIQERYAGRVGEDFRIETDFIGGESVYTADLVVTDWSSIAQEFSYTTKRPSLFINTPMKVVNPNWRRVPCVPLDISLRDLIGVSVDMDSLGTLPDVARSLMGRADEYRERITQILEYYIFDIGHGEAAGGEYIIARAGES